MCNENKSRLFLNGELILNRQLHDPNRTGRAREPSQLPRRAGSHPQIGLQGRQLLRRARPHGRIRHLDAGTDGRLAHLGGRQFRCHFPYVYSLPQTRPLPKSSRLTKSHPANEGNSPHNLLPHRLPHPHRARLPLPGQLRPGHRLRLRASRIRRRHQIGPEFAPRDHVAGAR